MNNFIYNASLVDVMHGTHADPGPNSMLIQICDILTEPPVPIYQFAEVHKFNFMDIEEDEEWAITDEQAKTIAALLWHAKNNNMNVIVHCHAGLCRSGAVVEVGIQMGFNPPDRARLPNALVVKKLRKALGMNIDEKTSVFSEEFYDRTYD